MNWEKANQYIDWAVRVNGPVDYEVTVNYDAETGSDGNTFAVSIDSGKQTLTAISGTVNAGKQQTESLGRVHIPKLETPFEIRVSPKEIKGGELFRLRKLELRPVRSEQGQMQDVPK